MLELLESHEGDLKDDLRRIVRRLHMDLGGAENDGNIKDVKKYTLKVDEAISQGIKHINTLCLQIKAGSSKGVSAILTSSEIAENALRRPERVLILNMFFLLFTVTLGATVFQFVTFYQFMLITSFSITAVVVVNALYLKSIGVLSEESFLKLMQLALLKFIAPLMNRQSKSSM